MAIPLTSTIYNPATGPFGTGQVQWFLTSSSWAVPPGVGKVRVRLWGAGGGGNAGGSISSSNTYVGGAGGGFALKVIYDLSGVTSIPVTVGLPAKTYNFTVNNTATGGTSSFGTYVSATGGSYVASSGTAASVGGVGIGGDINNFGGSGLNTATTAGPGGGGSASYFGNGGVGSSSGAGGNAKGGAGGGGNNANNGGAGFLGIGGTVSLPNGGNILLTQFSIDFIGTGGASYNLTGTNGAGASTTGGADGGFPGGGASSTGNSLGGNGLVIVEW